MKIPEWFSESTAPCSCCSVGKNKNFVEKTLLQISSAMEHSIFSEKYASLDGFLQKIDPRIKLITILFLIVVSSFIKKTEILLTIYGLTLFFAYVSKIELKFFIKRVWLFIPIFSGIIALPSIFNIVTPGESLITLIRFDNPINIFGLSFTEFSITKPGVSGGILFITRAATSVSLVVLLTLTTKWNELMRSLRTVGIPQIFVLILSMTYQYIFILLRTIQEMYFAKKSRTINSKKQGLKKEQNWIASRIGTVLMKSYKMSDEVHSAMISRGFSGDIKSSEIFKIQNMDIIWIIFSSMFVISILWINQ